MASAKTEHQNYSDELVKASAAKAVPQIDDDLATVESYETSVAEEKPASKALSFASHDQTYLIDSNADDSKESNVVFTSSAKQSSSDNDLRSINDSVADDSTLGGGYGDPPQEMSRTESAQHQVETTIDLLDKAITAPQDLEVLYRALDAVRYTANYRYFMQRELRLNGACERLVTIFENHVKTVSACADICNTITALVMNDNECKVHMGMLGFCEKLEYALKMHSRNADFLEHCCTLVENSCNSRLTDIEEIKRNRVPSKFLSEHPSPKKKKPPTDSATTISTASTTNIKQQQKAPPLVYIDNKNAYGQAGMCASLTDVLNYMVLSNGAEIMIVEAEVALEASEGGRRRRGMSEVSAAPSVCDSIVSGESRTGSASGVSKSGGGPAAHLIVLVCNTIAFLAGNSENSKRFQEAGVDIPLLGILNLTGEANKVLSVSRGLNPTGVGALWAIINLCADNTTGNKEKFGPPACRLILSNIVHYDTKQSKLAHSPLFHKLMEHLYWALINLVHFSPKNLSAVQAYPNCREILQSAVSSKVLSAAAIAKAKELMRRAII